MGRVQHPGRERHERVVTGLYQGFVPEYKNLRPRVCRVSVWETALNVVTTYDDLKERRVRAAPGRTVVLEGLNACDAVDAACTMSIPLWARQNVEEDTYAEEMATPRKPTPMVEPTSSWERITALMSGGHTGAVVLPLMLHDVR